MDSERGIENAVALSMRGGGFMKGKMLIGLAALLFMLAGCGSEAKFHVYEYPYDGVSVLNYTGDSYDYPKANFYTDDSAEPSASFDFNGTQYELTYYETGRKEFVPYEEEKYRNSDGVKLSFKKGTGEFCGIESEDGLRISDLENPETEEEFRRISDSFVKDYIDIENYVCSLTTEVAYFVQEGEKASRWFETKDSFYKSSAETETVQYIFTYRRYLDAFMTSDIAEVTLNPDGTLGSLILTNTGAFEDIKGQMVQQNALDLAVLEKLNAICPQGYQIENIQSDVIVCMDEAGQLFFFVSAKVTIQVASDDKQIQESCFFIIAKE